jgi:hypothetical protein
MRTLPGASTIGQVALVVRDLDRAMAAWTGMEISPWHVYTFGPERLSTVAFRGHEVSHAMRIALCSVGPTRYTDTWAGRNVPRLTARSCPWRRAGTRFWSVCAQHNRRRACQNLMRVESESSSEPRLLVLGPRLFALALRRG